MNRLLVRGTTDYLVCAFAQLNDAILVAIDNDMRQIAKGYGVDSGRYKTLSLLKLSCDETRAADRVRDCLTFIEHEWHFSSSVEGRRLFVDIGNGVIRSYR